MSIGLNIISIFLSGLLLWNSPVNLSVNDKNTECQCEVSMSCCATGQCDMMSSKYSHRTKSKNYNHCNCKQQQPVKQEAVLVIQGVSTIQKIIDFPNFKGFYYREKLTAFSHQNIETKLSYNNRPKPPTRNLQVLLCVFRL